MVQGITDIMVKNKYYRTLVHVNNCKYYIYIILKLTQIASRYLERILKYFIILTIHCSVVRWCVRGYSL